MPAIRQYEVRPCGIKAQDFAVVSGGGLREHAGGTLLDGQFLHDHLTDSNSVCRRMLGSTPATQRCELHPCSIKTQDFALFSGVTIRSSPGDTCSK